MPQVVFAHDNFQILDIFGTDFGIIDQMANKDVCLVLFRHFGKPFTTIAQSLIGLMRVQIMHIGAHRSQQIGETAHNRVLVTGIQRLDADIFLPGPLVQELQIQD